MSGQSFAMSSISTKDLYGATPPGRRPGDVQPDVTERASGLQEGKQNAPAMHWIGMVIALIILRVAWELNG